MKNKLPVLTATVLLAAGGMFGYRSYRHAARRDSRVAPGHARCQRQRRFHTRPTDGRRSACCCEARTQLERRTSVTARFRHQVSLDGRQLFGVGGYWQQGSGEDLHMRFELQIANRGDRLLQVSNGRFLWTDQRLPTGRMITRLDLRKVRSEWNRTEEELDDLEPAAPPRLRRARAVDSLRRFADAFVVAFGLLHVLAAAVDALDTLATTRRRARIVSGVRRRRPLEARRRSRSLPRWGPTSPHCRSDCRRKC